MFLPQWTISASDFSVRRKTLHDSSHKKVYLFQNLIFEGTRGFLLVCAYSKPAPGCLAWEMPLNKHLKENISQALLMQNIKKLLHWNYYWKRIVINYGQDSDTEMRAGRPCASGWDRHWGIRPNPIGREEVPSAGATSKGVMVRLVGWLDQNRVSIALVPFSASSPLPPPPTPRCRPSFLKRTSSSAHSCLQDPSVLVSDLFCSVFLGLLQLSFADVIFPPPFFGDLYLILAPYVLSIFHTPIQTKDTFRFLLNHPYSSGDKRCPLPTPGPLPVWTNGS